MWPTSIAAEGAKAHASCVSAHSRRGATERISHARTPPAQVHVTINGYPGEWTSKQTVIVKRVMLDTCVFPALLDEDKEEMDSVLSCFPGEFHKHAMPRFLQVRTHGPLLLLFYVERVCVCCVCVRPRSARAGADRVSREWNV